MEISMTAYQSLVNSTYRSWRDSIEGYFYYDTTKKAWFKIVKARFIFVSFEYAFGIRWIRKHHQIQEVKRCSKKKADYIMGCSRNEFNNLRA